MKTTIEKFFYNILLISVALGSFLNSTRFLTVFVTIILALMIYNGSRNGVHIGLPIFTGVLIFILFVLVGAGFLTRGNSQVYVLMRLVCLLGVYLLSYNDILTSSEGTGVDWFFIITLIMILAGMISSFASREFTFGRTDNRNYASVLVFMFFLYCNKKRHPLGIVLGIIFAIVFPQSRSYLLLFGLFYVCWIFKKQIFAALNKIKLNHSFVLILLLTVITVILSYVWVYQISVHGISGYHQSLNDLSNQQRFVANIYAFERILQDKNTRIWGYGSNLLEVMGINNRISMYMGVSLLQAHNSVLNLLLRMGILSGILYFIVATSVIDKYFTEDNIPFILPYLINSMFMHDLFEGQWIILFIAVLAASSVSKEQLTGRVVLKIGRKEFNL